MDPDGQVATLPRHRRQHTPAGGGRGEGAAVLLEVAPRVEHATAGIAVPGAVLGSAG